MNQGPATSLLAPDFLNLPPQFHPEPTQFTAILVVGFTGFLIKSNQSNQNTIAPGEGRPPPSSSFPHIFHPKWILQWLGTLSTGFVYYRLSAIFVFYLRISLGERIVDCGGRLHLTIPVGESRHLRRQRETWVFFFFNGVCWGWNWCVN